MIVEVKDYNVTVEFPDDTDPKVIQEVLAKNYPKKKPEGFIEQKIDTVKDLWKTDVGMIKNVWEGMKESVGGTFQALGNQNLTLNIDRASDDYVRLNRQMMNEDGKKRRQLGLSNRPFYYYSFNTDWFNKVDKVYIKKQEEAVDLEKVKRSQQLIKTGEKLVTEAVKNKQQNLKEAGAEPGSMKEFIMNLGTGFGEQAIPLGITLLTKNPAPFLTSSSLSSFGKTYGEAKLNGAKHESALIAGLANGSVDVLMNAIPIGEIFKPSNQLIKSVIKQAGLEGTYNFVGGLLKSAAEKGTITPNMTLWDALKRAGLEGTVGGVTGAVGKFLNLTVFEPPKPEPKVIRDIVTKSNPEASLMPDVEPKPVTEEDILKAVFGEIETPSNNNPDSIIPNPMKTQQTWTNTIHKEIPDEIIKSYLPEEKFKYQTETIQGEIETAKQNLATDKTAVIKRLEDSELLDSGVQVMELGLLIKDAMKNNDDVALLKYTKLLADKGTEYGRGLRAMQDTLKEAQTPEGAVLEAQKAINRAKKDLLGKEKDVTKKAQLKDKLDKSEVLTVDDVKYIKERMKKAQDATPGSIKKQYYMYDIAKRTQLAINKATKKNNWLTGLVEYTTGNILWSPDTILFSNISGNISRIAIDNFESFLHGSIHWAVTGGDASVIQLAKAKGIGYGEGLKKIYQLKDVFNELKAIHKEDLEANPTNNIWEWLQDVSQFKKKATDLLFNTPGRLEEISYRMKMLSSDPLDKEVAETALGSMLDTFGQVHGINFDLLQGVDTVQKYLGYYSEARGEIHRQIDIAKFKDAAEASRFENEIWNKYQAFIDKKIDLKSLSSDEQLLFPAIHEQSLEKAQDVAWQGDTKGLIKAASQSNWFKLLANKFVKTPYNLLKFSAKNFPVLNVLQKQMRDDLLWKNGKEGFTRAIAKQAQGFLIYGGLWTVVNSFEVTGGHPPEKRKALQEAGIPEYSFKGPDGNWHSYRRYEPLATILGAMATMKEYWKFYSEEEKSTAFKVLTCALATLDSTVSSTMFKGIKDMIDFIDPRQANKIAGGTASYLLNQEKSFLPFSTLFTGVQRGAVWIGQNPVFPEVRNWVDQINAIYAPWNSRPKLSAISGKLIDNEGSIFGSTIDHTEIDSPALTKIAQLNIRVDNPDNKMFGVALNDKEYWEYRRSLDTKFNMLSELNQFVQSYSFQNSPVGSQKKQLLNKINSIRRRAYIAYLQEKGRFNEIPQNRQQEVQATLKPGPPQITSENENTLY